MEAVDVSFAKRKEYAVTNVLSYEQGWTGNDTQSLISACTFGALTAILTKIYFHLKKRNLDLAKLQSQGKQRH